MIARLRDEIRRIEHRPGRREGAVPSGIASVDAALGGGGFPRGALSALSGGPASGKTAVALAVFAALRRDELAAYVDGHGELYPPAAAALGVDLARLLVVRPPSSTAQGAWRGRLPAALWAAEVLLASGAFAAVAIDAALPRAISGGDVIGRRLKRAAEQGGAAGLWLATRGGPNIPAAVRLELEAPGGRIVARRAGGSGRAA